MKKVIFASALAVVASSSFAVELWNNGTFVTGTGNGFGGANTSAIQSPSTTFGGNVNQTAFRRADNFTVSGGGWDINSFTFYGYQTQTDGAANSTSTFTGIFLQLWNGDPMAGGSVIQAMSGNLMSSTSFTGTYRVTSTTLTNSARAIMSVTADVSSWLTGTLPDGDYYIEWGLTGSTASGPWAGPIANMTTNGASRLFTVSSSTWTDNVDANLGFSHDYPFLIEGDPVPEPATMIGLGAGVLALLRRRRTAKA